MCVYVCMHVCMCLYVCVHVVYCITFIRQMINLWGYGLVCNGSGLVPRPPRTPQHSASTQDMSPFHAPAPHVPRPPKPKPAVFGHPKGPDEVRRALFKMLEPLQVN